MKSILPAIGKSQQFSQGQSNNRSAKPVKEVQQGNNYSQPSQQIFNNTAVQEFEDMPMLSDDDLPF